MKPFQSRPLVQQKTVADTLQQARRATQRSLSVVAGTLGISEEYLRALEHGHYNNLPAPVYIRHYLKQYANYLDLPVDSLLRLFDSEVAIYHDRPKLSIEQSSVLGIKQRPNLGIARTFHHYKPVLVSQWVRWGMVSVVIVTVLSYLGWSIVNFITPPPLVINQPASDTIVHVGQQTISGQSTPKARVTINDQLVALDEEGKFSTTLQLHQGLNTIAIVAQYKSGRKHQIVRWVIYRADER